MARLIGWECDKCNAQIKKDALPEAWGKIHIEYFDQRAKEELVWCNSCLANLKLTVPWNPMPTQPQPGQETPVQHLQNRAMFSRPPISAEQLLTSSGPIVTEEVLDPKS